MLSTELGRNLTLLNLVADILVKRTDVECEVFADLLAETKVILNRFFRLEAETDRTRNRVSTLDLRRHRCIAEVDVAKTGLLHENSILCIKYRLVGHREGKTDSRTDSLRCINVLQVFSALVDQTFGSKLDIAGIDKVF